MFFQKNVTQQSSEDDCDSENGTDRLQLYIDTVLR